MSVLWVRSAIDSNRLNEQMRQVASMMLQEIGIKALYHASQAELAMLASIGGQHGTNDTANDTATTLCLDGVVLSIGDQVSTTTLMVEGYTLPNRTVIRGMAGNSVTLNLQGRLSRDRGHSELFYRLSEEVVRQLKEKQCGVSTHFRGEILSYMKGATNATNLSLPDAQTVSLTSECIEVAEEFFSPEGEQSLPVSVWNELMSLGASAGNSSCNNVVLVGGGVKLKGLQERMRAELNSFVKSSEELNLKVMENPEYTSWLGGSAAMMAWEQLTL